MTIKLTDIQRTALGDCITYLLERVRQQKITTESLESQAHKPVIISGQLQAGNKEAYTTLQEQIDPDPGSGA